MAQNIGKIFEQSFMGCLPDFAAEIRLPDSAQSFAPSSKLRFSRKNPYDFILWNPHSLTFYALELKTVKGKSITFERTKEDAGNIHFHQIVGLNEIAKKEGTVCGFIIEFRELEKTIFLNILDFNNLIEQITKKSFSISDLNNFNIPYIEIPQYLVRTRYRYDIDYFFKMTGLHNMEEIRNEN